MNWELLVADDGSKDNTKYIIDRFDDSRIIITHNNSNQGNIRTRNRLFAEAKGSFITVLDADDWIAPDKLEKQVKVMVERDDIGACVTNYFEVDIKGKIKFKQAAACDFYFNLNEFKQRHVYPAASIMLRNEVYENVGGLHLYFDRVFGEDKYWIYLILERYKILFIKEPLYYYRANRSSLTSQLDSKRKLTIMSLIEELLRQRRETGDDWLNRGEYARAKKFEAELLKQKKWLSNRYRSYAARCIDLFLYRSAVKLLVKSFIAYPFNLSNVRTSLYLLKHLALNRRL